jgi:hypothetical protein
MATDLKELTVAAQEQTLKAVQAMQATVLDATSGLSQAFEKLVPASMLSSLPGVEQLGLDKLPSVADAIELGFGFTEKLMAGQRSFLEQLFATAAVTPAPKAKK